MAFFDFIGNQPNQVSLPELLAGLAIPAGAALMYRQGRVGGPLGAALTGFGGLGLALGERQQQAAQRAAQAKAFQNMPGLTPEQQKAGQVWLNAGGDPASFMKMWESLHPQATRSVIEYPLSGQGPSKLLPVPSIIPSGGVSPETGYTLTKPEKPAKSNWRIVNEPGVAPYEINADTGEVRAIKGAPTRPMGVAGGAESPITPTDITMGPSGTPGVYMRNKSGAVEFTPVPGATPKASVGPVQWRTETDATGRAVQVPYRYDPSIGGLVKIPIAGEPSGGLPAKLGQMQQKQIDSINSVQLMVPQLKSAIGSLPNATPDNLAIQWAKYRTPFGALGAVDPQYAAYFNQLGQIQTDLIQAAMGSSRAIRLAEWLKPHIPSPTDPPERALEKLKGFDESRFRALRQAILGPGAAAPTALPSAPSGAAAADTPPPAPPGYKVIKRGGEWVATPG